MYSTKRQTVCQSSFELQLTQNKVLSTRTPKQKNLVLLQEKVFQTPLVIFLKFDQLKIISKVNPSFINFLTDSSSDAEAYSS